MGMEKLQELVPFVKEALNQTARVASFFCCLHVINNYVCTVAKMTGPSMLPTINNGNLALADRITTRLGRVGAGDVVLLRAPDNPRKVVSKRVKGVEGDAVTYLVDPMKSNEQKTVVVPKGHVWIEGDNVYQSRDSRQFGPVPCGLLHSRVFFVLWPPEDFRSIDNKAP